MRNAAVLLMSRLVALLLGYVAYAVVSRVLSTTEFGVYGIVIAVAMILNTVLGTGTHQAVSRLTARHPSSAIWIRDRARLASLGGMLLVGVLLAMAARPLAQVLGDPSLAPLLRLVALVPGLYAVFAVSTGSLNGRREFGRQGLAAIALAVARAALICGATLAGLGVPGALLGTVAAAAAGAGVAAALARGGSSRQPLPVGWARLAWAATGFLGASFLLQLLLAGDLLYLKRFLTAADVDHQAGLYTAAQSIARIPYFLLLGVSQLAFPYVTARTSPDDPEARKASSLALSGLLVLLAGMLVVCVPLSRQIILLVYPAPYEAAGPVLGWLLAAAAVLSLAEASLTMLTGASGPRRSVLTLAVAVAAQAGLAAVLIPHQGSLGAARATLAAAVIAAVIATVSLGAVVGTRLRLRLLVSAAVPCALLALASRQLAAMDVGPLAALGFIVAAGGAYVLVVALSNREALASRLRE